MTTERTPSPCEWNPSEHRPAMSDEAPHAKAVWSVGLKPCWHLCDSCARLPEFQRKRRRLCGWDTIRASEVKSGDVVSWASSKKDAGSHYQNDEVHHVVDDKDSRRVVVTCYESGVHVWPYESEVFRAKGDDQ